MKFLKYAWIPACLLIVAIIVTTLILWRPPQDDDIEFYGSGAHYLDAGVSDEDERLVSSFVNNSATNFFVRGNQLREQLQKEETAVPRRLTFYERFRKAHTSGDEMLLSPTHQLLLSDKVQETDGKKPTGKTYSKGERLYYESVVEKKGQFYYQLGKGRLIPVASAKRICRRNVFEGTLAQPYYVNISEEQLLEFTSAGDYIYLLFDSENEFISLFLDGLPAASSWELYDGNYRKIGAHFANEQGEEIFYRAVSKGRFLLRINASAAASVTLSFHRDQNEWQSEMTEVSLDKSYKGVPDYFGDEDYFVVGDDISDHTDSLAMSLSGVDADLQVIAYDVGRQMIGRYTRAAGSDEEIVLYGLENVYCFSVRTTDGTVRNSEYKMKIYYRKVGLLGLETYGFKLSAPIDLGDRGENYYTAVCKGLSDKRIADVQTSKGCGVQMTLTTATGMSYAVSEGQVLPLRSGKNTLRIVISHASGNRAITIVMTDTESYDSAFAFALQNTTVYAQADASSSWVAGLTKGEKVYSFATFHNGFLKVEKTDGSGKIGWVQSKHLFIDYTACVMPASYASAIQGLQKLHPNWKFSFVRVDKSLSQAVAQEMTQKPIISVSGSWQRASQSQVEYYMNPLHFLNEQDIFMFEKQTYKPEQYSAAGVSAVWVQREEALQNKSYYTDCFLEAGRIAGLSPYFITARAALESGNGTSRLAKGECQGYEGYYNFYGINAVDSAPIRGASFAKEHDWNTQRKAIVEGAIWMKEQYISVLQYTPYFIKYSMIPGREWHQYMTDIAAPKEDAGRNYRAHLSGGTLNSKIEFVIPVFE